MITILCAQCGKERQIKLREVLARNYCSRKCYRTSGAPRPGGRTGTVKKCETCGEAFYAPKCHSGSRFCGVKCKGIASRLPKNFCAVCRKHFQPKCGRGEQPCCSRACGAKYRYRSRVSVEKNCEACGKRVEGQNTKYCSNGCFLQVWRGRNKTQYVCKICKRKVKGYPSRIRVYCSQVCRDKDPTRRAQLLAMNTKQQQLHESKLETTGYALLDELGIEYLRQHLLADKFCVDAFVPNAALIIQFDGDYWHGHPEYFPAPDARQLRRMRLDLSQNAYLSKCGYNILRVWESTMHKNRECVKASLLPLLALPQQKLTVRV